MKTNSIDLLNYVSRETVEKYELYFRLLKEWNRNTSLVQLNTLEDFYSRHVLDSLQLLPHLGNYKNALDMGTGAGFPGMVLAIAGAKNITLCDSTTRKTVFLNEVKRQLDVDVTINNRRIESLPTQAYDLILSRAYTDLSLLLEQTLYVSRETQNPPIGLFLKGQKIDAEIEAAKIKYDFNYDKFGSITNKDGVILKVYNIRKL